jgi:hypothetical protein
MTQVLFIAEKPAAPERNKDWDSFVAFAKDSIEKVQSATILNDGTYLCNLSTAHNDGLNTLGILVGRARAYHIPSRTLFFDQDPSWIYDKPAH